jgi:CHAD domain-containing protein
MSFELDPDLSTTKAVRRVARKRLDRALELLASIDAGEADAIEEAVHDVRKRCKEVRSLARLIRPTIGDAAFDSFNSAVREAAAELGPIRDSHAVLETFGNLLEAAGVAGDAELRAVRSAHAADADRATRQAIADTARIERATSQLRRAQRLSHKWAVPGGFAGIGEGVETVYRGGRRALAEARHQPTDASLHEWRKSVKHLFHAMQLVEAAAPSVLTPMVEQLDHLGDALGDDHDLAVLVERLGDDSPRAVELARTQQSELRRSAFRLGETLYAEKPAAFSRRIERYWDTFRSEGGELKTGKIGDLAAQAGT